MGFVYRIVVVAIPDVHVTPPVSYCPTINCWFPHVIELLHSEIRSTWTNISNNKKSTYHPSTIHEALLVGLGTIEEATRVKLYCLPAASNKQPPRQPEMEKQRSQRFRILIETLRARQLTRSTSGSGRRGQHGETGHLKMTRKRKLSDLVSLDSGDVDVDFNDVLFHKIVVQRARDKAKRRRREPPSGMSTSQT